VGTAIIAIADMAEHDGADRAHEKSDCKRAEGREQRDDAVAGRKELLGQNRREEAVNGEVVPFEHVADDAGRDDPPQRPRSRRGGGRACRNCNTHRSSVHLSAQSIIPRGQWICN
jgi:hypothetical protein